MKNMLYVTTVFEDENDGIWKKIKYTLCAYQRLGYLIDFAYRTKAGYVINFGFNSEQSKVERVNEHHKDLFFYNLSKKIIKKYDFLYIRKPFGGASFLFLNFLISKVKKGGGKVAFEIPTYPYRKEIKSVKNIISERLFQVSKSAYVHKIDLIVYMGESSGNIWGRPALKIANGIDLNKVQILKENLNSVSDEFIFVGVARLSFWHGYDRLIEAVKNYKGNYKIKFIVIGNGEPELSRLNALTKKHALEEKVLFLGAKFGNELDMQYKKAHVCIDSIGRHRSGNQFNSSLKSKEYAAKGLPFIMSHKDDSFENVNFIFNVSPDEEMINIDEIISWYEKLPTNTPVEMRAFAEQFLSWDIQCKKVLENIFY
ncbi:TPA: glycosyltransferase [Raoultella planticola]|uniref:Glycosyltransferase n=2 Tax=Klebsiella/Raoultella group TaxID=2890311 RepID=A0ABU5M5D0_RAOPL|nr:glycosyltransferase [Raoultella planticola]BAO27546.1 glycosyltransferase [Klebsiella sp. 325]ELC3570112.1 glycosyltransferase [Raoultella planticola]ELH7934254.1 glycosyltransferase [Raoultella planticola]MCQ6498734.1 glycosyltransferase [Raoultella planticola]MDW4553424.1 glycosyltransferase [Raoultella planticola]